MRAFTTILLLTFIVSSVELQLIDSLVNNSDILIEALLRVIESDSTFTCRTLGVSVLWETAYGKHVLSDIATKVLPTVQKHALTIFKNTEVIERTFHFIWIFETLDSFSLLYRNLSEHWECSENIGYRNGYFLLVYVFPTHVNNNTDDIHHMLGAFNKLKIFGAILMIATPTLDSVNFYASSVVQPEACYKLNAKIINTYKNGQLQGDKMFEGQIMNFQGCPLVASVVKSEPYMGVIAENRTLIGFEGEMIMTIMQKLNATLNVLSEVDKDNLDKNSDTNITDLLEQLKNRSTDFVAGLQVFSAKNIATLTPSTSYMTSNQILVLRRSKKIKFNSDWIFSPFPYTTWICIGLTCGSLLLVSTFMQFKSRAIGSSSQPFILQMFAVMLGIPSSIPRFKLYMYRTAFFITCFGVLILRNIYQGKVFSTYRFVPFEETPQTFDKLMFNNYTVYAMDAFEMPGVLTEHSQEGRPDGFRLLTSDLPQRQNLKLLEQSSGNVAVAATVTYYNYHLAKHNKYMVFKKFPKNVVQLKACIYFRRHSYLAPSFNAIINRLLKSGILLKWFSFYAEPNVVQESVNAVAINWTQISLVFIWHAYLCGLATVVFILEILRGRYKKWRNNKRLLKTRRVLNGRSSYQIVHFLKNI